MVTTGTRSLSDPASEKAQRDKNIFAGFALGGVTFILMSYALHCKLGMGPWKCQCKKGQKSGFGAMKRKRK